MDRTPPHRTSSRSRRRRILALFALPLAAGIAAGCRRAEPEAPPTPRTNLLLISIDTLRADHVHCAGYARETTPHLDRLAAEGVLFEQHVSNTSWTLPSHATMLTGLPETVHGVETDERALDPARESLAEILKARGYATAGFYSGPYLHPTFGIDQGFDVYESAMARHEPPIPMRVWETLNDTDRLRWMDRHSYQVSTGPEVVARATAWLEAHAALSAAAAEAGATAAGEARPFFLFLHFFDCHWDYMPPERYWRAFDPDYAGTYDPRRYIADPAVHAGMDPRELAHVIARYDGEILFTDEMVGRVLAFLEARGLLDDTLVAVTSDHGEEFFEHGFKGHRVTLFDEALRIPLIVRLPGTVPAGVRVPFQTTIEDVAPTLLSVLGVERGAEMTGADLSPAWRGGDADAGAAALERREASGRLVAIEGAAPWQRFLRGATWKLITGGPAQGAEESLFRYDLAADPREQSPARGSTRPDGFPDAWMRQLHDRLEARDRRDRDRADELPWLAPDRVPEIDAELRRQLIANGYLAGE